MRLVSIFSRISENPYGAHQRGDLKRNPKACRTLSHRYVMIYFLYVECIMEFRKSAHYKWSEYEALFANFVLIRYLLQVQFKQRTIS